MIDERTYEFLIIPRFLISREKINRLNRDETLQKNFEFLVYHKCLGHYNNEANKKMPEEVQMVHVRQLLNKNKGERSSKKYAPSTTATSSWRIMGKPIMIYTQKV